MKFSDLAIGDYVWWSEMKSNIGGDYDLVFHIKKLSLNDFAYMAENEWNEYDLNEFVKPIEITHKLMTNIGLQKEETWSGIVQYTYLKEIKDGVEYKDMKFSLKEYISIEMSRDTDFVRNIKAHSFNANGVFTVERIKSEIEPHYLHELQHVMRECEIDFDFELPENLVL